MDRGAWRVTVNRTAETDMTEVTQHSHTQWGKPWIFIGRTEAEVEAPILWPPDAKIQIIGKDPDAGKD